MLHPDAVPWKLNAVEAKGLWADERAVGNVLDGVEESWVAERAAAVAAAETSHSWR
jgi:hypothetical protein